MIKRFKMRNTKYRFILRVSKIGILPGDTDYHEEIVTKYFTIEEFATMYTSKILGDLKKTIKKG